MKITHYHLPASKDCPPFRAALVADLHDRPWGKLWDALVEQSPDLILIPGDLCERLNRGETHSGGTRVRRPGLDLLRACASLAPTYYTFGNHEVGGSHGALYRSRLTHKPLPPFHLNPYWQSVIEESGVTLLFDDWLTIPDGLLKGVSVGGLGSGLIYTDAKPRLSWLANFAAAPGYKILLCHHPEYYFHYLRPYDIDLVVSGHAHGGQWRVFGRGVYAPDQGLFPRYTSGTYDDRLVISRGVANSVPVIPRFFNPCELVMIEVGKK